MSKLPALSPPNLTLVHVDPFLLFEDDLERSCSFENLPRYHYLNQSRDFPLIVRSIVTYLKILKCFSSSRDRVRIRW